MGKLAKNFRKSSDFLRVFFVLEFKFMKKETNKKAALLDAFDKSETKKPSEVCRIAGVALSTFYFHQYKDPVFRRQVLEKQREHLSDRIASV